jgi:hypothetical protein
MSKIALTPNASGTGTFTIAAPNSNTDRTLTLPDEAGTVLTSASSISASNVTGLTQGITSAHQWRMTSSPNLGSTQTYIASPSFGGLEEVDTNGYARLGSSPMTVDSSGVWTFPETGIWLVHHYFQMRANVNVGYFYGYIQTDAGGGFNDATYTPTYVNTIGSNSYANGSMSFIYNVTDTSTHRVRFAYFPSAAGGTVYIEGGTNDSATHFDFIRLGDAQ